MATRIWMSLSGSPDKTLLQAIEIDFEQVDLLCPKQTCTSRNEVGSYFCCDCGTKLRLKSDRTTRPLNQNTPPLEDKEDIIVAVDVNNYDNFCSLTNAGSGSPDEWYQRRIIDQCGDDMRQLIKLLNCLRDWYILSPSKKGAGMDDQRLLVLSEVKEILSRLSTFMTELLCEDFKARIKATEAVTE